MSGYKPSGYKVVLFDRFGAKVRTVPADSFCDAMETGESLRGQAACHSFAITRVLYNSLSPHFESYDVRRK